MLNKNERAGKIDQAKGKVKQAVGDLTGNDKLKTEGKVDETVGDATARLQRFADALKGGEVGTVDTLARQLRRVGGAAAAALTRPGPTGARVARSTAAPSTRGTSRGSEDGGRRRAKDNRRGHGGASVQRLKH